MSARLLLGIDIGTSSVKAGAFSPDGGIAAMAQTPVANESPRPSWVEARPERWWRAVRQSLAMLEGSRPGTLADIGSVGFSALFPAVVAMDAKGRPLRPAILYSDGRSAPQVEHLRRKLSLPGLERRIANRIIPGTCAATSIMWIKRNEPEIYRRVKWFALANSFIAFELTGRVAVDRSGAGLTGLFRHDRPESFDAGLCRSFGIGASKLPDVLVSSDTVGTVTGRAAGLTGLRRGIPVAIGGGDAVAAAFGGGLLEGRLIFYIAGTTDCPLVVISRPPRDPAFANCCYCVDGRWCSVASMNSSGASVGWFARNFVGPDARADAVEALAGRVEPGAGGVIFLPYLQGERTPWWDSKARGAFLGLDTSTGPSFLARSVLEGTAFGLRHNMETLENAYSMRGASIVALGGGTQNRLWMRIKASVLGRPIHVLRFQDAGALGAALLGGIAAGVYKTPSQAIQASARLRNTDIIRPDAAWARRYRDLYPVYKGLYPKISGDFHALADFRQVGGSQE